MIGIKAHPETHEDYVDEDGEINLTFGPNSDRIFNRKTMEWEPMTSRIYTYYASHDPWLATRILHKENEDDS